MLVVEDNVDAADSLSLLLRLYGHEVDSGPHRPDSPGNGLGFSARRGAAGHRLAGDGRLSGCQRLRERPEFKDVMICALTGYTPSEADRQRQQETGFDHYYVKPVNLATLLEMLKSVVAQKVPATH